MNILLYTLLCVWRYRKHSLAERREDQWEDLEHIFDMTSDHYDYLEVK